MPRLLPGNTSLGQEINKSSSGTDFLKIQQNAPPKRGIISRIFKTESNDQYIVILVYKDPSSGKAVYTSPMMLLDHPAAIAQLYGSPQDLIGKYWCELTFYGNSSSRGTARIIRSLDQSDEQDAAKWNELPMQGSAFAAPGSGFPG